MLRALRLSTLGVLLSVLAVPAGAADAVGVWDEVEHHFAQNQGVKIHYVTLGSGPDRPLPPRLPRLLVQLARSDGGALG